MLSHRYNLTQHDFDFDVDLNEGAVAECKRCGLRLSTLGPTLLRVQYLGGAKKIIGKDDFRASTYPCSRS